MRRFRRTAALTALALCVTAASGGGASAAVKALTDADAGAYANAFKASAKGDFDAASAAAGQVSDKSLLGYLQFEQLTWRGASATYGELKSWLAKYADLPGANRILQLARKLKPRGADLKALGKTVQMESAGLSSAPSRGQGAREAYYSGDMRAARRLAESSGERWVAGLAAFRVGQYPEAMGHFQAVALDPGQGEWVRAGAAYWAARSAIASGSPELAPDFLRIASRSPWTFYGLLAERQLGLEAGADPQAFALAQAGLGPTLPSPDGEIVRAAYSALSGPVLARLVKTDVRAKRAVALYQIGRAGDAGLELRAGLASARTDPQRRLWTTLALELNGPAVAQAQSRRPKGFDPDDYPTPKLTPIGGFTIDKALVYAIVRQESRFDPNAVSSAGAIGLMQLMPQSAAQAAGDDKLLTDASPLYDPATNLRVGQDYVQWLMDHATSGDVLRAVAAYNGGPGSLMRAQQNVGDSDPLMLIESLPAAETRDYVEKVVAAYWVYRRMFGESARSIDSIAGGASTLPARMDR